MSTNRMILRVRKGHPGVGRKLSRALDLYEATCNSRPAERVERGAVVINYGRSEWPIWNRPDIRIINPPPAIAVSSDKLHSLEVLTAAQVPTLQFTTDVEVARNWNADIIVRHILNGKQGRGVEFVHQGNPIPEAPLYTKFYDKTHEFRVHICRDAEGELQVIDYVQKKRMGSEKLARLGLTEANMLTRNHKKGWVFAHNNIINSQRIRDMSVAAVAAIGLDFGAVDILARVSGGRVRDAVVCEVNSAPGMSSTPTFTAYVEAFRSLL